MLKDQNIICISSIDWDFVWQGHQEIMSAFAKSGNRILFIENTGVRTPRLKDMPRLFKRITSWIKSVKGFREVSKNVFTYSPLIIPLPYSRLARFINKRLMLDAITKWMKATEFYDPIVWTFLPTGAALDIANGIGRKLLVYYCIADFSVLSDNPNKVRKTEDELIARSDLIFAQGEFLEDRCSRLNGNVHIFQFGVNIDTFDIDSAVPKKTPVDIRSVKKPIIGYIGGLHRHMDLGLIKHIAQNHPEWSVVLIGPEQTDISILRNVKNILILGKKDFQELPGYIKEFDVGIIPYELNSYTKSVFPTKLNEYHAMGKPVVSTLMPEIVKYNIENDGLVFTGSSYAEFTEKIAYSMANNDEKLTARRIESAKRNSWTSRIEEMSRLMEKAIDRKKTMPVEWRDRFLKIYRATGRRIVTAALSIALLYLLLFHTPLIWGIAAPLKLSQPPERSDCIVVFAGGVGESGKVGQGYEERVKYAVDLYKTGYAKDLIFSSGYYYAFKETEVMKALAVSLGVPPQSIILEERAANAYENVKFTSTILRNRKMKKAIVISSRYNMRRIALISRKISPDIYFVYSPVTDSLFFGDGRKVEPKHIIAILHEYASMLYYLFKGYI
jgi:uncharacterized SAM-binding protein YcdF (DUF218 family)